jgi:broad specificity phosphatase PhoE
MPSLFAIRHGQADHNVAAEMYGDAAYDMPQYWNPSLTKKGIEQAQEIITKYPSLQTMRRIVTSPLQRALETAYYAFPNAIYEINDLVSEKNPSWKCNRRIDAQTLRDEWPQHIVHCSPITPINEETDADVRRRAAEFLRSVRSTTEDVILISHYDFIMALLTEASMACDSIKHCVPIEILL